MVTSPAAAVRNRSGRQAAVLSWSSAAEPAAPRPPRERPAVVVDADRVSRPRYGHSQTSAPRQSHLRPGQRDAPGAGAGCARTRARRTPPVCRRASGRTTPYRLAASHRASDAWGWHGQRRPAAAPARAGRAGGQRSTAHAHYSGAGWRGHDRDGGSRAETDTLWGSDGTGPNPRALHTGSSQRSPGCMGPGWLVGSHSPQTCVPATVASRTVRVATPLQSWWLGPARAVGRRRDAAAENGH
jgi:hypothetical protein